MRREPHDPARSMPELLAFAPVEGRIREAERRLAMATRALARGDQERAGHEARLALEFLAGIEDECPELAASLRAAQAQAAD